MVRTADLVSKRIETGAYPRSLCVSGTAASSEPDLGMASTQRELIGGSAIVLPCPDLVDRCRMIEPSSAYFDLSPAVFTASTR